MDHAAWRARPLRALVLAGGTGARLRPITDTLAKQLIPIANQPVLFYCLEAIRAAGIAEVGIVVGKTANAIQSAVGDGSEFGLNVTYISQREPLGLAHAVIIARRYLGADDFVMFLGDIFVADGIARLVNDFRRSGSDAQVMLTKFSDPQRYGVVKLDCSGQVAELAEKPQHPESDLALAGVYAFTAAIHEAVRAIEPSDRGELEITDAIQGMVARGLRVLPTITTGHWKDAGSLADLLDCNRIALAGVAAARHGTVDDASEIIGRVLIEEDAHVTRSSIVGPVIVGAGTQVMNSRIGPFTSIGPACAIVGSEIAHSIVLRRTTVEGAQRIEASLLGDGVRISALPEDELR